MGLMSPIKYEPDNPDYRSMSMDENSWFEVLHLKFDNSIVSYEQLVKYFYTFHDPTTLN